MCKFTSKCVFVHKIKDFSRKKEHIFLSKQDYLERLKDFFPKRSINLAVSKTLLDFSIWKNVNGGVPWVGALGPPSVPPGPRKSRCFSWGRVGVGRGPRTFLSNHYAVFFICFFFFNLICKFISKFTQRFVTIWEPSICEVFCNP